MSWAAGVTYGADSETTGVSVFDDRIVTFTVAKVTPLTGVTRRTWLIDPGIEIPEAATNVHGITTEHARTNGVHPTEALDDIATTVVGVLRAHRPLVLFNAAYDLSILEAELRRHNLTSLHDRLSPEHWHFVIDPFVLGKGYEHVIKRQFVKGRTFKLPDMCDRYGVPFTESHEATADATGAVLLAVALAKKEKYFTDCSPEALHQLQKTWRREDMHSLRKYFDKQGTQHDGCDGGWPLHTDLQAVSV